MQFPRKAAQAVSALVIATMVAGCTLPRSGPTTREILSGGDNPAIGLHIVSVTPAVAAATHYSEPLGFGSDFTGAGLLGADVIRAGDTLSVAVWENVDAGLLAGVGQKVTAVDQLQVDQAGNIFMPYVGQIEAAGRTPEQLRTEITRSLAPQTPDPQVEVRRIAGDGSTVSVLGAVASAGSGGADRALAFGAMPWSGALSAPGRSRTSAMREVPARSGTGSGIAAAVARALSGRGWPVPSRVSTAASA